MMMLGNTTVRKLCVLEQVELELPTQHQLVVVAQGLERPLSQASSRASAAMKGNELGMFAHTHEAEAKVGLRCKLLKVDLDELRQTSWLDSVLTMA